MRFKCSNYTANSSKDLSYSFLCINIFGLLLMVMYGILKNAPPLYIPTSCSMILAITLLLIKVIQSTKDSNKSEQIINV